MLSVVSQNVNITDLTGTFVRLSVDMSCYQHDSIQGNLFPILYNIVQEVH